MAITRAVRKTGGFDALYRPGGSTGALLAAKRVRCPRIPYMVHRRPGGLRQAFDIERYAEDIIKITPAQRYGRKAHRPNFEAIETTGL